jgi:hypothetical protein
MNEKFNNSGGPQNAGIGDRAVGSQVNNYGVSPELFAQYVSELALAEAAVNGFFLTLLKREVPRTQWDSKLREIAAQHKELRKLLADTKFWLPALPEKQRAGVQHEVEGAEFQLQKDKPDKEKIVASLKAAQKVLEEMPGTVAAAVPVGELIGKALIWCAKVAVM